MQRDPAHLVLLRGGGDLASGVALRLWRAGFAVLICELAQPLSVRRAVSFSEAIYEGEWKVEELTARKVDSANQALACLQEGVLPVLAAPELESVQLNYTTLVDARLTKGHFQYTLTDQVFILGLGPGFIVGQNCHAVIETQRGHNLGRVLWQGAPQPDTGEPDGDPRRVLRAPMDGIIHAHVAIGDHVQTGQVLADVNHQPVIAPFEGVLRGLIRPGLHVQQGLKIGDVDARGIREYCFSVSDKALAVGGAVLEAILLYRNRQP